MLSETRADATTEHQAVNVGLQAINQRLATLNGSTQALGSSVTHVTERVDQVNATSLVLQSHLTQAGGQITSLDARVNNLNLTLMDASAHLANLSLVKVSGRVLFSLFCSPSPVDRADLPALPQADKDTVIEAIALSSDSARAYADEVAAGVFFLY